MIVDLTKQEIKAYQKWAKYADSDGWATDQLTKRELAALKSFEEKIRTAKKPQIWE